MLRQIKYEASNVLADDQVLPDPKKIAELKAKARTLYIKYHNIAPDAGCGNKLMQFISSDAAMIARQFDQVMDELRCLDPSAPAERLSA